MKRTKKSLVALMLSMVMMLSFGSTAFASTEDKAFNFTVDAGDGVFKKGNVVSRSKDTDTKVYVYLTSAPYAYIQVQTWGRRNTATTYYNETVGGSYATIMNGIPCSVTNNIFENAGYQRTFAYIKLRSAGSAGAVSGVWSSDSTRNYTVVN